MRAQIEQIGQGGDGIATIDGNRWYIPFAAPGDVVDLKPEKAPGRNAPNRARVTALVSSGAERVAPPCPHFGQCGGCALQHVSDDFLQGWKLRGLAEALQRKGFDITPTIASAGAPGRRRRASFSAKRSQKGHLRLGFHERRGKGLADIGPCPVLAPEIECVIGPIRLLLDQMLPLKAEGRIQVNLTDGGLDILLDGDLPDDLRAHERFTEFAHEHDIARLSVTDGPLPRTVLERRPPHIQWDRLRVVPPPGSFLQADPSAERQMQALVRAWSDGAKAAVDLFSGVGTLTSALPEGQDTLAVDADVLAIQALKAGIDAAPGVDIRVAERNLYRRPLQKDELKRFDLAVLDPPAAGAKDQCETIAQSGLGRVIYISCAPGSFARDARILAEGGFELTELRLLDQFYWSPDIELAACFLRSG